MANIQHRYLGTWYRKVPIKGARNLFHDDDVNVFKNIVCKFTQVNIIKKKIPKPSIEIGI